MKPCLSENSEASLIASQNKVPDVKVIFILILFP